MGLQTAYPWWEVQITPYFPSKNQQNNGDIKKFTSISCADDSLEMAPLYVVIWYVLFLPLVNGEKSHLETWLAASDFADGQRGAKWRLGCLIPCIYVYQEKLTIMGLFLSFLDSSLVALMQRNTPNILLISAQQHGMTLGSKVLQPPITFAVDLH